MLRLVAAIINQPLPSPFQRVRSSYSRVCGRNLGQRFLREVNHSDTMIQKLLTVHLSLIKFKLNPFFK